MITKIVMNSTTSFKSPASLETNKKVNLIYGLNGTGKSTISNFLANPKSPEFSKCSENGIDDSVETLVYNQNFVEQTFFAAEEQKGIFTLSKKNVDAEKELIALSATQESCERQIGILENALVKNNEASEALFEEIKNQIWEIKLQYSGGDRVLEYCFEGLKRKENLFSHVTSLDQPTTQPDDTVVGLKREVNAVEGDTSSTISPVRLPDYDDTRVCSSDIWSKTIVGNQNSTLSDVIKQLGNSDWVKTGKTFVNLSADQTQTCPFCQEETVTVDFVRELQLLFDESYEQDNRLLLSLQATYENLFSETVFLDAIQENPVHAAKHTTVKSHYQRAKLAFERNRASILSKVRSPSSHVVLESLNQIFSEIVVSVTEMNANIETHNDKVNNRDRTLANIAERFWALMRWSYDGQIVSYQTASSKLAKEKLDLESRLRTVRKEHQDILDKIRETRKKTININEAVERIKNGLIDLGIDGFTIENHKENLYRIVRPTGTAKTFHSLSEGEKMIISFLYFIEMCRGIVDINGTPKKKIVVIDDPISSLSHIFVFNISQLIKAHFTSPGSPFEQVFILTHSLYFFYDLTFMKKEDRELHQSLFRLVKNAAGSSIEVMGYTEIQNDYHSYWHVVKDPGQSPALIANCMRNIIEYFFTFVEKYELINVFQKPSLQGTKYQAFLRYINRESHSLGQNIFDIKEFDYDAFKDAFRLVFFETGYENHYKKMLK